MKKSKTEICINGKVHEIWVKTCSFSDFQSIYLDGKLYIKFKGKPASYHMFYNLCIDGKTVTVDIDTSTGPLPLTYKYKVYINGVSIDDGTSIDKERQESLEIISHGLKENCRRNIEDALGFGIATALVATLEGIIESWKDFDTMAIIRFSLFMVAILLPLFSMGMLISKWIDAKGVVKKWDKRYQPVRVRKEKYYM